MKYDARTGFTIVEMLIGVVMMSIVIAGIAFTVRFGFNLFTTADSNAAVISGVRFTADSFKRTVAPMLNVTDRIELISADKSIIPSSVSEDIHYVFFSDGSVVHRDSKGDHVLEGSEYIENIEFSVPAASDDTEENYIFKISIKGKNNDYPNAKLDLEVENALYNRPEKIGTPVSGDLRGTILKIRARLYLDRLDLYDNDTKIRLNGLSVHKGTNIEAVYDLINQTGTSRPMSDDSLIEWFISGSVSADLSVTKDAPTESNGNSHYWQLVSGGVPITGKVLDTTGAFHLDTGEIPTNWDTGVIRCRVTPVLKSAGGGMTYTGTPKWSDYVVVRKVEDPSEDFEDIGDFISSGGSVGDGDFNYTNIGPSGTGTVQNDYRVSGEDIILKVGKSGNKNRDFGATFVMKLQYDRFDNTRIYSAWAAGRSSSADIPSYITPTGYSLIVDSELLKSDGTSEILLSTRPNGEFLKNGDPFLDVGYAVVFSPPYAPSGFYVSKYIEGIKQGGESGKQIFDTLGVSLDGASGKTNVYDPYFLKNSESVSYTYKDDQGKIQEYYPFINNNINRTWTVPYRIMYTVLEYYIDGHKESPCFIFRVRLLKMTDTWDKDHDNPEDKLSEIKKTDPWCIGPKFYVSEPMWFGKFLATHDSGVVKNYDKVGNTDAGDFYRLFEDSNPKDFYGREMKVLSTAYNETSKKISSDRYIGITAKMEQSNNKDVMNIYNVGFAPGFSINEIRSIMPENGKLYSIEETIPASELTKIQDKDWYKSYKLMIASSGNDINKKIFGLTGKSAGTGDNGSWYYQNAGDDGGIYDLQHINDDACECPLHNELFKWLLPPGQ